MHGPSMDETFSGCRKRRNQSVLRIFIDAFDLDQKKKLAFSPDDRVIDIYRTMYPKNSLMDDMECERLVIDCEEHYGIDITKHCPENATLGDIFNEIKHRA